VPLSSPGSLRVLLLPALAGGIAAGTLAAILQQIFLVPMILQAEAVELGGAEHVHHDIERVLYTGLFDCIGAFGFALLLAALFAWRGTGSWKRGLAYGLAGYASFALAPALGLPPELPGADSAALLARQVWWVGTALATAAGIACIAMTRAREIRAAGLMLLVLPHVVGAPGGDGWQALHEGLARSFAVGSLAVSLMMWSTIGVVTVVVMRHAQEGATLRTATTRRA
jgi:cobalt transporter subunit CbtA